MTTLETAENSEIIERMFKVGAHFGFSRTRRHPSITPYIFGSKNRAEIFDLEKTSKTLLAAKEYMKELGKEGKTVLFVGGKNEAQNAVREGAQTLELPYVAGRWIGGTLTNFFELKKRVDRFKELRDQREKGELEKKYTKKERLLIDKEIVDLETNFGGVADMDELPHALFIVDTKREHLAHTEAQKKDIPVIGLLNSDCDSTGVLCPIVANDASAASIQFVVQELVDSYQEGLKEGSVKTVEK